MDIPLVNIGSANRTGSVAPVAPAQVAAVAQAQTAAAMVSLTTVDLSPLGRFLSAVTLFQKKLQELQSAPGPMATERDSGDAFAAVAAAALGLADSVNELQASSLNGTSDDQSLATLFGQQFAALAPDADDGDSAAQLAAIGLTFTSPSGLEEGDVLNVDLAVLQEAFASDPEGTTALLARAGAAFSALAGIAPGAGDEIDPSDLTADAPDQAAGPALVTPQPPPDLPDAAPSPAQVTSDGAFLQELLAETPRPGLSQAAPPSVADANANFAAQRAADINAQNGVQDQLAAATAVAAQRVAQANARQDVPGSVDGSLPVSPELPAAASPVAARATENAGLPQTEAADEQQRARIQAQADDRATAQSEDATQASRTLAGQALAAQEAVRDADALTAGAVATTRAAQAARLDGQAIDEAAIERGDQQAGERMRLAEAVNEERLAQAEEQKRLERSREAREHILDEEDAARPRLEQVAATVTRPVTPAQLAARAAQADQVNPPVPPRPLPPPVNQAQLAARDPAVAAAIAAYNLSAGPFAALNVRPELAAPKIKTVPSVETVTKVEPIEDDGPTNTNSRPSR